MQQRLAKHLGYKAGTADVAVVLKQTARIDHSANVHSLSRRSIPTTPSAVLSDDEESNDRVTAAVAVRQTVDNTRNASAALTLQHAI
ncbi:MAG: hypothetical protein FRX49_11240 [Trebouxia sp. A1-2]|nr:MAG: hypothetical protein FRX49_11240 [Trebouxia sp. A1-2]